MAWCELYVANGYEHREGAVHVASMSLFGGWHAFATMQGRLALRSVRSVTSISRESRLAGWRAMRRAMRRARESRGRRETTPRRRHMVQCIAW